MKPASFEATPEFQKFHDLMGQIITVSKPELDAMVQTAKETSPRKGDPHAPGRKRSKAKKRRSR